MGQYLVARPRRCHEKKVVAASRAGMIYVDGAQSRSQHPFGRIVQHLTSTDSGLHLSSAIRGAGREDCLWAGQSAQGGGIRFLA
jgi:hypothetical protein